MIIVSQDREMIVNFNRVNNIWIDDNILDKTECDFEIYADDELLGSFKTEERAKEVLQEIVENYGQSYLDITSLCYKEKNNVVYRIPET